MNKIIILLSLMLCKSNAQLTSPGEAVCVTNQVVFGCQQTGSFIRWTVGNLPRGINTELTRSASSSQVGIVLTFADDPGFGFEIHVLSSSSASSVISELRVTAVRQLNGATVECAGSSGLFTSTIQIISDPPAAPSEVMTTADQSQFTPSTASITLTWSVSSGADNYTIMVTPLLPSGQSLVSTTTTSLQLTVIYNEEYSINITAQNCVGSNSTIVPLTVVGCSPPSPLANGSISEYSSGAVGAMLTFQCDTGYMPQEEVTSTCLPNRSWVPTPECQVTDCGSPFAASGVIIDLFNDTIFGAMITFRCACEEDEVQPMTSLCSSNGEWNPDPNSLECGAPYSTTNPPAAPSGVMTTADQRQFTPSTASITITWSANSGADNYTIMVTPLLPSGQSLVSTTTTSLQLTVLYNEEYSINITAHNCAGSNSTIVPLTIVGCSPPSPLANGSISEYSSGAVGAMLTFQCDTGYLPQEEVTSTCLSNSSWVPTPECQGSDISRNSDTLFTRSQMVIITSVTAIICSLVFLILGMFLGGLIHHCIVRYKGRFNRLTKSSHAPQPTSAPSIYEEVSPDSQTERKNDIELSENVAYGPVTK